LASDAEQLTANEPQADEQSVLQKNLAVSLVIVDMRSVGIQSTMGVASILLSLTAFGQSSSAYNQAAQDYLNAAAQCANPAGAACMRQNAQYYQCLARQLQSGASCAGPPSCSTACTGGGGTASSLSSMGVAAGMTPKAQAIGQLAGLAMFLMQQSGSSPEPPSPPPRDDAGALAAAHAAQAAAAEAAAEQAQLNANAADTLNQANALFASLNGGAGPSGASPSDPSATAAITSLLGTPPSQDATAAVTSLLGDSSGATSPPPDSTAAVVGVLSPAAAAPPPAFSPQFVHAISQIQDPPADAQQGNDFSDAYFEDKVTEPTLNDLFHSMQKTAGSWVDAAGDLVRHPIDSATQALGSAAQTLGIPPQNPNAEPDDVAMHDCMVGFLKGGVPPYPAGGDAAAAGCGQSASSAVYTGLNLSGLVTD